jgi:tetratricopeptide (TPR) repeat protein
MRGLLPILLLLLASRGAAEEGALERARALAARGELGAALAVLREAHGAEPENPEILLELGRTARLQAEEVLRGPSPALGRLALEDAERWFRKLLEVRPEDPEGWRELGRTQVLAGRFADAATSYGKAVALDPEDGESRYHLGYALAYQRKFAEALPWFVAAEELLGPDPRVLLNRGISHATLGQSDLAEATLIRLIDGELAAGRSTSFHANRGVLWLWRVHSSRNRFDLAEGTFARLAERHPDYSAAHWYLANARWRSGNVEGAIPALSAVTALSPRFANAWELLARALLRVDRLDEAATVFGSYRRVAPDPQAALRLGVEIVEARFVKGEKEAAMRLLDRLDGFWTDDPDLLEKRGDLLFRWRKMAEAVPVYRRAAEENPFSEVPTVKAQKAVTTLLRAGSWPLSLGRPRPEPEEREPGEGGALFDFEENRVFARTGGKATVEALEGAWRLVRTGKVGEPARLALTMIPTLDTRDHAHVRLEIAGPRGATLRLLAKDGFDEFGASWIRLRHFAVVTLTGEAQSVDLPLDGFETPGRRTIPFDRSRLRMLFLEIGQPGGEGERPAPEVTVDRISLVDADGGTRVLADFDALEDPTLFLSGGAASAFAPTLMTPEEARARRPSPNTYVRPTILGEEFAPDLVHGGEGSFRLTVTGEGASWGDLTLGEARSASLEEASAIVFWARGARGGERLRVELLDLHDGALANPAPASAPRLEVGGVVLDGRYRLIPSWRRYRIARRDFPDVDLARLRILRFRFGTDEGNERGATVYLDDIGWE